MAKALETALPGFKPSPLQLAAIERIQEFQAELAEQGIYMRSSMELEFVVEDYFGNLIPCVINLKEAEKYLTSPKRKLPHLEQVKTDVTAEYEITVADKPTSKGRYDPLQFSPLQIAGEMAILKKGTLRDMLQQTTCLTPEARGTAPYRPVFHAYPFSLAEKDSSWQYESKSSALHVNVSLYDAKGNNLFAKSPALLEHCARSLIDVQNEAGLAFLPKRNSLKRVRPEAHGSVPGGLGMEAVLDDGVRRTFSSVNIRGGVKEKTGKESKEKLTHDIRIENRLPGADNDPFVALAITMAAMVDAVRHDTRAKPFGKAPTYYFADTHEELVDTMKSSAHMRELLGSKFHAAIINEYDKSRSASR